MSDEIVIKVGAPAVTVIQTQQIAGPAGDPAAMSDVAPVDVTKAAAIAGVAEEASRQDHKHDIATAAASSLTPGGANAEGSATSLARSDHGHALPAFGSSAGTFAQGNDARLSDTRTPTDDTVSTAKIQNDAVTFAKLQNIAVDTLIGRSTSGTGDPESIALTAAGRALIDDADAAAQRTTLGLGTLATQDGTFSGTSSGTNTGDQTITLTGDVTGSGTGSFAATIANDAVTFAKLQNVTSDRLLGRDTAASGDTEEITVGGGLEFTGSAGVQRSALTGDVTATAGSNATTIANDAVTFAKMQNIAVDTLIGRSTSGTGDPESIALTSAGRALIDDADAAAQRTTLGLGTLATQSGTFSGNSSGTNTGDQTITLTGDVTGSGTGSFAATIANDAVTFAKMQNVTSDRLLGRDTASSGDAEEISVGGGLEFTGSAGVQRSALTGDVTATAGSNATTIANDAVTDAKLRNSGALSVVGRSANSSGDPADISASAASDAVLRESGSTIGFGTIATAGITDAAITLAKMANLATDRLIGRDTTGTGVPEALTVGGGVEFSGSGGIQRSALTGDVTATAGSNATTIANDAVTYAKMQNVSATDRLLGRDTAAAGDVEELTVGGGLEFTGSAGIQRSALTGDVTASAGSNATTIANDAVTYAKIQNVSATDRLLGRDTAAAGDIEELTVGGGVEFTGSAGIQRSALTGYATASAGSNATTVVKVLGTATNDNATAGDVGQYVESVILFSSAVTYTTATAKNLTSISLTAGDWDVSALFQFNVTGVTTVIEAAINTTSATIPASAGDNYFAGPLPGTGNTNTSMTIPTYRLSLSATTTVYAVARLTFSTGAATGSGRLSARRVR